MTITIKYAHIICWRLHHRVSAALGFGKGNVFRKFYIDIAIPIGNRFHHLEKIIRWFYYQISIFTLYRSIHLDIKNRIYYHIFGRHDKLVSILSSIDYINSISSLVFYLNTAYHRLHFSRRSLLFRPGDCYRNGLSFSGTGRYLNPSCGCIDIIIHGIIDNQFHGLLLHGYLPTGIHPVGIFCDILIHLTFHVFWKNTCCIRGNNATTIGCIETGQRVVCRIIDSRIFFRIEIYIFIGAVYTNTMYGTNRLLVLCRTRW